MNGIHDDVSFLVGRVVEQARRSEFQLLLKLDGKCEISIEGDVTWKGLRSPAGQLVDTAGLEGRRIAAAEVRDGKDLVLKLHGAADWIVHDSNPDYESFTVSAPGVNIVV